MTSIYYYCFYFI